ncbi:hypothetical protein Vadar_000920 [Vaccinium darrowii]|uniref:Uncharacterized protein n=1 Tax=Vaccinium darrowii TaxID=229202 RepID=A0ACB7YKD3_9ERIC|nr:hypothetical protein Vadar_000920 [Vaccinium darrowii]
MSCLQVSLPNLEVLDIADLENLERLGHGPLSVGSLSKLKEFSVNDCGKLLCVFASHLLPMLQDLEKLIIKCCNLLEVVFELEGVDCNEPNPDILSPLKLVELHCLPKLNYISRRDPMGFKYIQTLDIIECDSLRCVFSPTMTTIIPQLRKLKIWSCEKLSRIVAEENGLGESTMDEVEFPQLETVELRSLPNLVSFFPNMNTTLGKSTGHYHNPLQSQPLFNEKVAVPSLKYLELIRLENVSNLWCSELPTSSFSKLKKLEVRYCASLRNIFHPSMARGLVNLQELIIKGCSTLEAIVGKEEEVQGGHGRKIDKTLFPQLGELQLGSLPNLRRFCHFTHPLELPLLNEMDILFCPRMDEFSLGHVSAPNLSLPDTLWNGDLNNAMQLLQKNGDDPMVISKEKPRTLDNVTDKTTPCQLAEIVDPTQLQLVVMPDSTNSAHKVAQLLYNRSGDGVLAARSNGILRLWKWGWSEHNLTGKATARIVPHLWQPPSGRVMANDLTGVNLEKAVPCMALSENGFCIISACGGKFKLFNLYTFEVVASSIPPPPASTFAAFYSQCYILAIGMEDSTIHIYNVQGMEIKSKLRGHQKCITGLVFSTNLKILVSSGADAQLCIWTINTWEKLKSVPIQLPAGKARNGDTRVQFHSDQTHLLVSHETQLAIYDASNMDRIRQWVPQDVLPAPISFAAYSCNSQIVYTSFCDGNIGVFDADSLTLRCRIAPSAYLSPALLSGSQAVYPSVIAAHPQKPGQFAIGLTEGSVIVMERPTIRRVNGMLNGRTASSSNGSNDKPDQKREKQYWSLDDDSYSDDGDDDDGISSLSKVKELQNEVDPMSITLDDNTDKTTLWPSAEIVDPTQCRLVAIPDSTNEAHKVARVLYANSGNCILALQCNGIVRLWKWGGSQHSRNEMATASVVPQQWQPASGLAMTNDVTGVNLEEAVPCIALPNDDSCVISACGGHLSKFDMMTFKVMLRFMPSPPASTFLALYPKDNNIIAIGMEDSTIHIGDFRANEVQYILKGHQKHITGFAFSSSLKIMVSSGADAQLCTWSLETWENLESVPIQLPACKPCNGNTRVQFHSDQIHLLVSHETQLAIYDAFKMDRICQWVPQDVLPAPISCATYSCDSQLVYASFCDGNIGVFDADSLMPRCRIVPSAYLSPALSSGSQAVYPLDIAAHPRLLNQLAIGLTDGSVIVMEPPKKPGLDGGIASSSNASNQTPDQGEDVDVDEDLDEDVDEDALITTRTRTSTATTSTHDEEEDLEEKRKKEEEEKEKKGKAPLSG